jgi:hypothetical protein
MLGTDVSYAAGRRGTLFTRQFMVDLPYCQALFPLSSKGFELIQSVHSTPISLLRSLRGFRRIDSPWKLFTLEKGTVPG